MHAAPFLAAPAIVVLVVLAGPPAAAQVQPSPADTLHLSLADVLTHVREEHPIWKAASAKVLAAQARAADRSSTPNPRLRVEPEALTAVRVELLQPIRWPWESSALKGVGVRDVAVATADAEADRRAVLLDAAQSFADGLRSARALTLAMEAESLAQHTVDEVASAVEPAELAGLQTMISLDEARRAVVRAQREQTIAQARLAVLLGDESDAPIVLGGDLETIAQLTAPEAALASALATDPKSARLGEEAARADQEARLARARRWPSFELGPAVTVGERTRVGLALGLILPLWNRQREAVRAAHAERDTALAGIEVRHRELRAMVLEALVTLARAETELGLLRSGGLARTARANTLAEQAAPQGGAYVLVWLAAREAYLEARAAELDLEWQGAEARLVLRSLTGSLVMEESSP
ncbi:MAG TPA: TolC family protein [Gemmatimonadales bacterium]|nr:TolC family protein [Gemmatimonadales bacterium]